MQQTNGQIFTHVKQIVCKLWEKNEKNGFLSNRVYVFFHWCLNDEKAHTKKKNVDKMFCALFTWIWISSACTTNRFTCIPLIHTLTHSITATTEAFQLNTLFDLYQFFNGMKPFIIFFHAHVYMAHKSYLWPEN